MTATTGFSAGDADFQEQSYPTAFGVTFTPTVQGILLAVIGLGLAGVVATQVVAPAYEEYQQLQQQVQEKQQAWQQKAETTKRLNTVLASLKQAELKNQDVRSLFSDQAALETLLLDLNQLIVTSGAQLLKFKPDYGTSGILTDASLGPSLQNKLKQQVTEVSFHGSFNQTISILQAVDRSQTVLVLKDFNIELSKDKEEATADKVTSTFKLYAYVPLSPEETKAAQAAAEAQKAAENAANNKNQNQQPKK